MILRKLFLGSDALSTDSQVVIAYVMIDFKGSFGQFFATCYTLSLGSTAIAVVMGALSGSSPKLANGFLPLVLLPQMLFVGFFVQPELIPSWLRWIQFICPMTYSTRLLLIDEFHECSEDFMESLYCDVLLESVDAVKGDRWWYWLILGAQFVVFRCVALVILQRSAQRFY